ncbi:hypothetical protein ElyMa_004003900 [Elysia marginata]|uniref:Secreted protein n=1 Tax=Elysia marginata TaxID=1093978 RepID=A0AAV4FZJ1_9GAST|nr:hypothetical protein ElyMa_004003900 [Elysia marginata]
MILMKFSRRAHYSPSRRVCVLMPQIWAQWTAWSHGLTWRVSRQIGDAKNTLWTELSSEADVHTTRSAEMSSSRHGQLPRPRACRPRVARCLILTSGHRLVPEIRSPAP